MNEQQKLLGEIKTKWNELYGKKDGITKFANYMQMKEFELQEEQIRDSHKTRGKE